MYNEERHLEINSGLDTHMPTEFSFDFNHDNNHRGGQIAFQGKHVYYDADVTVEISNVQVDTDMDYDLDDITIHRLALAYDDELELVNVDIATVDPTLIREIERHILNTADIDQMIYNNI